MGLRTNGPALSKSRKRCVAFIPCAFQYNPAAHQATNPWLSVGVKVRREWLTDQTRLQEGLQGWASAAVVPYLDLTPSLRQAVQTSTNPVHYPLDGHLTPQGHRVIADAVREWLRQSDWIE